MKEVSLDLDRVFIGFNRKNFIEDIFAPDFQRSVRKCAEAIGLPPNYLRDIIYQPTREAGIKTLTRLYRYCIRTGRDPERYIFVLRNEKDGLPEDEEDQKNSI